MAYFGVLSSPLPIMHNSVRIAQNLLVYFWKVAEIVWNILLWLMLIRDLRGLYLILIRGYFHLYILLLKKVKTR